MNAPGLQKKQSEWFYQWERFEDDEPALFADWILPQTLEDFRGKRVLDAGCGPGHHMRMVATVVDHVTGVDLNTSDLARSALAGLENVSTAEADIATFQPSERYDVVYCVGVIHHTDDPDATFANLKKLCRTGGRLIIWCYSSEGNWLVRRVVEPLRENLLRRLNRTLVRWMSSLLTLLIYSIAHTLYRLPIRGLPYYEYLENFRKLSFRRNALNVFDKLNAPQTEFITRDRVARWFDEREFRDVSITAYRGVSWRASGTVRGD